MRGASANNYTFTKALGEGLVTEYMDTLPVIIQRPSAGRFKQKKFREYDFC